MHIPSLLKNLVSSLSLSLCLDVFINFVGDIPPGALGPTYVVAEDNGMVTVCLSTSTGTARDIVIEVTPEEKSVANAASKLTAFEVCMTLYIFGYTWLLIVFPVVVQ